VKRTGITVAALGILICLLPLSAPATDVATVSELQNAIEEANNGGDPEILLLPGTYQLKGIYMRLTREGVTVAGKNGIREDVIVDGEYITTEIFQIAASHITVKDLTLKRARYHPIHVFPIDSDVLGTVIQNVHIIGPGQQAIKINQNNAKTCSADFGTVAGCRIELTSSGRDKVWEINGSCYTGGVDAHHASGWKIVDNEIAGFWCASGLSEHGVHFWSDSRDTLVARNRIVNCDRGIGFGLGESGHSGGIIRNNMIFHDSGHSYSDVGIGLENAAGAEVYNNTLFHHHSYPNAIEFRFPGTNSGFIKNNLTNKAIVSRNGGSAEVSHNLTSARGSWFQAAEAGDLHLCRPVGDVVDKGTTISGLDQDYDKQARPAGRGIDLGADEWTTEADAGDAVFAWLHLLLF
jgi:hypothetical protein